MKIVYLHQYFNLPTDGGGTRSYEMARRLAAWGHDVHVVTSDRSAFQPKKAWRRQRVDGIEIHWLPVKYSNSMGFGRRIASFFAFALHSAAYARRLRGDVVFATSTPLTIVIPGAYATVGRSTPMVFEVRDLWPEMPIAVGALSNPVLIWAARALERFAYSNSTHVVALSPGMKRGVEATGYPTSKISMIPNSCDLALFSNQEENAREWRTSREWLQDRPMVLYCGTLGKVNNVRYLAEVAAEAYALNPDVRFVVVGAGAEEDIIRTRATELGVLGKNFFMLRQVPKTDVPAIFAAADVCTSLFAPIKEMESNSANKFFDALAAGKPLAINYGGWHEDLINLHGLGIRVDPCDYGLAARSLIDLLEAEEELESAGRRSRVLAETEFARDGLAAELCAVLQRAVTV